MVAANATSGVQSLRIPDEVLRLARPFLLIVCSQGVVSPQLGTSLAYSDVPAYGQI